MSINPLLTLQYINKFNYNLKIKNKNQLYTPTWFGLRNLVQKNSLDCLHNFHNVGPHMKLHPYIYI